MADSPFSYNASEGASTQPFAGTKLTIGGLSFVPAPKLPSTPATPVASAPASPAVKSALPAKPAAPASPAAPAPAAPANPPANPPSGPAAYIPFTGYGAPQGLTRTTTPQGGTAWQDAQGNMYVQDAGGFKLVTSLPGQNGKTVNYQTRGGTPLTSGQAGGAVAQAGQANPGITVTEDNSAQNPGNVPVGPTPPVVPPTPQPAFNSGSVAPVVDMGNMTSSDTETANVPTAAATDQSFQAAVNDNFSNFTASTGASTGTEYTVDPEAVAGGDPTIMSAITSDPAAFLEFNKQFGVPQLQQQYLNATGQIASINSAVAQLSNDIQNNPDIPQSLALKQISYLSNKANVLLTPLNAQATTIKAQLSYATANMKAYYSQFNATQRLSLSQSNAIQSQFKTALTNGGIDASDPASIQQWATATGYQPSEIYAMATNANVLKALTIQGKNATVQKAQVAANLLNDPQFIEGTAQALVDGNLAPSELSYLAGQGMGPLRALIGATAMQINPSFDWNSAQAEFTGLTAAASTANSSGVILPLTYIKSVIPNMQALQKLSANIPRTSFPALNSAEFQTLLQTGDPNTVAYLTNVTEVADQVAKILQGGGSGSGSTDAKLEQAQNLFSSSFSADQLNAVINTVVPLLQNRESALSSIQYNPIAAPSGAGGSSSDPAGLGL